MDLFTTAILLAGAKPPANKLIDGIDLRPALFNQSINDRYFRLTFNQSSVTHFTQNFVKLGGCCFKLVSSSCRSFTQETCLCVERFFS